MKSFTKKYQLWIREPFQECDSCKAKPGSPQLCSVCLENRELQLFTFKEFDTVEECIVAPKGSNDWYITKKVSLSIKDSEDVQPISTKTNIISSNIQETRSDEIDPAIAANEANYLRGFTGTVN